jgi:NADH-quinone oxidoreductase subunit F
MIRNEADLQVIQSNVAALLAVRQQQPAGTVPADGVYHVMLCFGTGCVSSGAVALKAALLKEITKHRLGKKVRLVETGCNGFCAVGPIVVVYPGAVFYNKVQPADAAAIVREHLLKGRPVQRLLYTDPQTEAAVPCYHDIRFFQRQNTRVLHNKGLIAAESLEEYIGRGGYFALAKALESMKPEDVVAEVKKSGLRGRGGAGFPTGTKWELCRAAAGQTKYILCNADEGDPGAFMDRSLIEADPHVVLEGLLLGGYAIGAGTGYIYCRAEYPLALKRLHHAIAECRRRGLLGRNILNSGFSFDIQVAQGAGAFVCGEETALMRSVEGRRGEPRPRPPFPAHKGLWDCPSVLNNVETFGNVPLIIRHGADWYRQVGTVKSPGTKIFALTGKVRNVGLVEVPIGIPLGEIIYDIGGGIPGGKQFKAAQIGGPSGGCIPRQHLNVPVDYESIAELGAIMGSGGLIVMDEDSCMVDMARFFLEFTQEESCGKCTPCRIGTKRMLEILERICAGKGEEGDIERLIELGNMIKDTALCGLGQTAPNPVLSTIRYFRHEYEAHIRDKRCPAGVCANLVWAPCTNACPAGVNVPGFVSLVGEKRYAEAMKVHRDRNPLAAICGRVCFHPCETKCRRSTVDEPLAIRAIKRFMADKETKPQLPEMRPNKENAKRKVAIVGAGPAGLSCAYFLARLGYKPTIFEAASQAGGMLVQTIPAYRLPRKQLEREIKMIRDMGVKIQTNKALGKDFTLKSLQGQGYQAAFVATGAPQGLKLGIPGEAKKGVQDALEFLRAYNLTGAAAVGKKVAVVGGGNAAIDAARTALRLGAETVTVVYRRTRAEMPAYAEEIHEAEKEGVQFLTLTAPLEVVAEKGRAKGLKCRKMKLGDYDTSGRRGPKATDQEFVLETDQVITAIGQALDRGMVNNGVKVKFNRRQWIDINPQTGQTSLEWVFAGGDAATGPASVVEAIAAGERAAGAIDQFLTGADHAFWRERQAVDTAFDPDADPVMRGRTQVALLDVGKRKNTFAEVELAWNDTVALKEAARCLRCDYRECEKK